MGSAPANWPRREADAMSRQIVCPASRASSAARGDDGASPLTSSPIAASQRDTSSCASVAAS